VKDVASSGLIDVTVMKTSVEFNLLVAAGLMKDEPAHQKRLVKINTGLVFKQQKYNLLREETEGYSKLSVMLCNEMPVSGPGMTAATVSGMMTQFVTNVFSVVGHFDLEVSACSHSFHFSHRDLK
jgi:THO complex subunit 2